MGSFCSLLRDHIAAAMGSFCSLLRDSIASKRQNSVGSLRRDFLRSSRASPSPLVGEVSRAEPETDEGFLKGRSAIHVARNTQRLAGPTLSVRNLANSDQDEPKMADFEKPERSELEFVSTGSREDGRLQAVLIRIQAVLA
ncbi:MAG: hypothetical protein WBF87_00350 [Mesorhizobium sp.]